ncbi:MAG: hypothetical protein R3F59_39100, partial [Myxococcota bacterium]
CPTHTARTVLAAEDIAGRVPSQPILAGELIREERLTHAVGDSVRGLHAVVPRGMAAVTITVESAFGIRRDTHVDVLDPVTRRVLYQSVPVLAVLEDAVTLQLEPSQALALAKLPAGRLRLALRNDLDTAPLPR